ncbi:IS3 family transposase [Advenella mandrilli]|uniref:IS3 family transposase n=1 Tax=Advenella mandrilli TaxID=2800330 RepID=UPI0038B335E1
MSAVHKFQPKNRLEPIVVFLRGNSRRHWAEHYKRIKLNLNGLSPVQYRTQVLEAA